MKRRQENERRAASRSLYCCGGMRHRRSSRKCADRELQAERNGVRATGIFRLAGGPFSLRPFFSGPPPKRQTVGALPAKRENIAPAAPRRKCAPSNAQKEKRSSKRKRKSAFFIVPRSAREAFPERAPPPERRPGIFSTPRRCPLRGPAREGGSRGGSPRRCPPARRGR